MTTLEQAVLDFDHVGLVGDFPDNPDCCELCHATAQLRIALESVSPSNADSETLDPGH